MTDEQAIALMAAILWREPQTSPLQTSDEKTEERNGCIWNTADLARRLWLTCQPGPRKGTLAVTDRCVNLKERCTKLHAFISAEDFPEDLARKLCGETRGECGETYFPAPNVKPVQCTFPRGHEGPCSWQKTFCGAPCTSSGGGGLTHACGLAKGHKGPCNWLAEIESVYEGRE